MTDKTAMEQMCCVKPSFPFSLRIQAICHNFFSLPRGEKSDSKNFRKRQFRILRRQTSNKYRQKRKELLIVTDYYKEPSGTLTTKRKRFLHAVPASWLTRSPQMSWLPIRLDQNWAAESMCTSAHFVRQPKGKTKTDRWQLWEKTASDKEGREEILAERWALRGKKGCWKRSNNPGEAY